MKRNEPITKIMSTQLITVHHGEPLSKVRQLIRDQGLHHVPVVSGDQLVGMLSSVDILKLNFGAVSGDERAVDAALDHGFKIEDIMETELVTLTEHSAIREAAEALISGEFHSLPVVNGGKLVGLVTSTDLIRYLLEQYQ
jgi:CBS domain-containing protein